MKLGIFLISSAIASQVWGAACCVGTSTLPGMMVGNERQQFTVSVTQGEGVGEVRPHGTVITFPQDGVEARQSVRIDGAFLASDRWQASGSINLLRRSRYGSSSFGWGDIQLSAAYEALPEWSYSSWQPKIFVFGTVIFPTSPSVFESAAAHRLDVRGRGFIQPGAGALAVKAWGSIDAFASIELHHGIARSFPTASVEGVRYPGLGYGASGGMGWSPFRSRLRLGTSFSFSHESPVRAEDPLFDQPASQQTFTASLQAQYLVDESSTFGISYADSALIPLSRNAPMLRLVQATFQHRWLR